jgi:NAD(P)-dependent dehydrogenase (short-subunit alcohol dehydrogenase family)
MNVDSVASHFDLSGKVILVTGGSRGLGLEMCRAFGHAGASLIISSRKQDACDAAAAQITEETGAKCLPVAAHVGDWDACDALVEAAYAEFGQIDVLVNNAGMSPLYPSLTAVSRELFDKVIGVNLAGPFRLAAVVGERMVAGEGGSIINVSSNASLSPGAAEVPYGAAKAGLNNMTQALARVYAPKVRTNVIIPGPFLTDISDAWDDKVKAAINRIVPLGRAGEPGEIVGIALYLASDASSYTNGSLMKVDGGMSFG